MPGMATQNLPFATIVDEILGNAGGNTRRIRIDRLVALVAALMGPTYATRAGLFGDLGWPSGSIGYVRDDGNAAFNGVYKKAGSAGSGSWSRIGDLPTGAVEMALIDAINAQLADTASRHAIKHFTTQTPEGTGNAAILQTAESQANSPFLNGCLLSVFWPATNTAPDPTATLRGTTYLINRLNGATVQPGDLVGNRPLLFIRYNDERLRLVTPVDAADIAGLTQALADARARANHTGTQPISTVDGLPAALQGLSDAITAAVTALETALNQNGVKFYDNAAQAVSNGANALPSGIVRILTIEAWGVAVRSRNSTTDALYGTAPYWGISRRLTTEEAVAAAIDAAVEVEATARAAGDAAAVQRANHTGTQPISTVAGLPDALSGLSLSSIARDATEAEAREAGDAAAIKRENHTGVQAIGTISGLPAALADKAPLIDVDRIGLADISRPGEDKSRWSTVTTGAPEARPPLTIGATVVADYGAALRISGADIPVETGFIEIGPRKAYALESDRIYMLRALFARAVNSADPAGDGIEMRVRNLNASKVTASNVRIGDPYTPAVADGLQTVSVLISRAGGEDIYQPPATARYITPILRIYGVGQSADLVSVQWADVTDIVAQGERLTDLESRLIGVETVTIDALGHSAGVRELGTSVAPTITWSLSRTDIVASATINGVAVDPAAGSYSAPSISATTGYTMVVTDDAGRTVDRSTSVAFLPPMFVGTSPLAALANGDLAALDKLLLASPALQRDVIAEDGDYIWVVWDLTALGPQAAYRLGGLNVTPVITDRTVTTPAGHTSTYRLLRSPAAVATGTVPVEVIQ